MLPFSTLPADEKIDHVGAEGCGFIPLPRWNCISLNEQLALENLGHDLKRDQEEGIPTGDARLKARVITILFQSRLDPEWTLEKTLSPWETKGSDGTIRSFTPQTPLIDALYEWFFVGERNRWQKVEEVAEEEESQQLKGKKSTGAKSTGS